MDGTKPPADLYPPIAPHATGRLAVGGGHEIYWEAAGNPDGAPVVFLHGGPGAGCAPVHRRFFDPAHYRVILFDQRGCGKSTPFCGLEANTTDDLVADVEALRGHLGVDAWWVFGGSWGATLALAYGQAHPERCLGFVLRGVFLGTRAETDWFLTGMARFFPEAWARFSGHAGATDGPAILEAYRKRLADDDPAVHGAAANAWAGYETACSRLVPIADAPGGTWALALARLEAHYFAHDFFLAEGQLMANLNRIAHLPARIVQGRYDVVCPPATAHRLAAAWPEARLTLVDAAGHAATEDGIRTGLVAATDALRGAAPPLRP